ncbi:hypothetical protein GCM10023094_56540 [Rhodococcus olei]|uniref:Acyl dehydratase n=1 Tax=Rhodococcus olei TaxID=2161675 RepID=A0ABP8PR70_9NOCA
MTDMTWVTGAQLDGFDIRPDPVQLFCFSAATWNPHRIHYDERYARDIEGYDGVLVQGPLLASWLLRLGEAWASGWGRVTEFDYISRRATVAGDVLHVRGEVTSDAGPCTARVWIALPQGDVVCEGQLTVTSLTTQRPIT